MPNRILKESICTSENIDDLSWFEEVVFYRLIVNCDDYGRMDGRSKILKARLFPLKSVTDKQISDAVQSLRTAGIVDLYFVDGKPFLQLRTWDKHQQTRAKKSKFPPPVSTCNHLISSDINCNQMISNVPVIQSNPIQSESESESESNTLAHSAAPAAGESAKTDQFEVFWEAYPKKKSKGDARKAFAALKNVNLALLLSALEEQKKSKDWLKEGGQFIPYPATWLRRCCWEDEQEVNTENAGNTDYGTIL